MPSLSEYFERTRYKAKYEFGTRVFGYWNKIPFVGAVGSDSVISDLEGPRLTITLDLPIKFDNRIYNAIIVKHKDIKRLKNYDTEEKHDKNIDSKTSSEEPVLDSNKRKRKSR